MNYLNRSANGMIRRHSKNISMALSATVTTTAKIRRCNILNTTRYLMIVSS